MDEDKKLIAIHLTRALKLTRYCDNLEDLIYYPGSDDVIAHFKNGRIKFINISNDSGWAMIHDILRALE